MSLQQTLELVTLHHVFWKNEEVRAPAREQADCRFFSEQCWGEIAALERELSGGATYTSGRHASERKLSTARPPTRQLRRREIPARAYSRSRDRVGTPLV